MPPKESKETKAEIAAIIGTVKSLWPDFPISSDDLAKPTAQFVERFYSRASDELDARVQEALDDDAAAAVAAAVPPPEARDFDGGVHLFCRVSRLFRRIRVDSFCINDIYMPAPKRTRFFVRAAAHFLLFVESNMEHCRSLTEGIFKQVEERQKLHEEKQNLLQKISESAEQIANSNEEKHRLLAEKKEISEKHEAVLNLKRAKEKLYADRQLQIEKVTAECQNEEYQLKYLEEELMNLKIQVVTEEEFQDLKRTKEFLEKELEKLSQGDADFTDGLDLQREKLEAIKYNAYKLSTISMDGLSKQVDALYALEEQKNRQEINNSGLAEEIKHLRALVDRSKMEVEKLSDVVTHKEHTLEILRKEMNEQSEHMKKELKTQRDKTASKLRKAQEMTKTIETLKDGIDQTKSNMEFFKQQFETEYKKVLDTERRVVNKIFKIFTRIKTLGEGLKKA